MNKHAAEDLTQTALRPLPGGEPPRHVAIIMDGNGRWAGKRGLPRTLGHRKGVEAVRRVVRHAGQRGIRYLTLYAFSRENWKRPKSEVTELMSLLERYISTDLEELVRQDVCVRVIGGRTDLEPRLRAVIDDAEARTRDNGAMQLILAFNYGGRDEIVRAARRMAEAVRRGDLDVEAFDELSFAKYLDTGGIPDPDLVIRTSGELRISNFLIWQSAYAEYVFPRAMWPDFDEDALDDALRDYHSRQRRFGAVPVAVEG